MTRDRYCCDGLCNDSQGRGTCPAMLIVPPPTFFARTRNACAAVSRWVQRALIKADIACTEDWIRDCERDGILDSRSLSECRKRIQTLRVDLALLEKPCSPP
jgi:hypothetical protein